MSERYVPFATVGLDERFAIMRKLSWSRNGVAHERSCGREGKVRGTQQQYEVTPQESLGINFA